MRFAEWSWVRDGLERCLETAVSYYRQNPMAVPSEHFLVRLLGSISVPQSLNVERYYDNVDALALNLSMSLKMTSSIFPGAVFGGVFYGPGCHEVLLAHTGAFNPTEVEKDWQSIQAIQVLRSPRSDLQVALPDGQPGQERGLAVVAINIPLLAVQYRAFRQQQLQVQEAAGDQADSVLGLRHFIHMYVLPNMLASQMDQQLFNRLNKLSTGEPLGQSTAKLPFAMPIQSFQHQASLTMLRVLERLREHAQSFTTMLQTIPAVSQSNMEDVMRLPGMAPTRQVDWALTISRLHALAFLFRESRGGASARNQMEINALARAALNYSSNNVFRQYLPATVLPVVQREIGELLHHPQMLAALS